MKQLPLPISWAFSKSTDDFVVSDCNRYAFEWLEKWPLKIQTNFVCLVGESGSGKTHLAHIWSDRLGAEFLKPSNAFNKWYEISSESSEQQYYVFDDADELDEDILLFYIYNTIKEKNAYLLLTAKNYPNKWNLKFEDIKSRLATVDIIRIQRPNESAINSIIEKMLLQRGIKSTHEVVEYISNRIERSYESIRYWINKIDSQLMDKKGKLSLQKLRTILENQPGRE